MFMGLLEAMANKTNETLAISHFYGMEICLITVILDQNAPISATLARHQQEIHILNSEGLRTTESTTGGVRNLRKYGITKEILTKALSFKPRLVSPRGQRGSRT